MYACMTEKKELEEVRQKWEVVEVNEIIIAPTLGTKPKILGGLG